MISFLTSDKKYEGMRLVSEKMEALYADLIKTAEAATSSYSAAIDFLQYTYPVLVAKNHHKIQSRCLVKEFYFTDILLTISIMVTEQPY